MQSITTIGLDLAKSVFQVHGIDAEGNVVLRRQLKRRYVLAFFQKLPPWCARFRCVREVSGAISRIFWCRLFASSAPRIGL
jgi:transposase